MKETILKLLGSPLFEDVLIGIELSYNLPFEEFHKLYTSQPLKFKSEINRFKVTRFARRDMDYLIIWDGRICIYKGSSAEALATHKYLGWVDLGHKNN